MVSIEKNSEIINVLGDLRVYASLTTPGTIGGQDYKEKHKTRLKTNVKRTVLNNTKLRHF